MLPAGNWTGTVADDESDCAQTGARPTKTKRASFFRRFMAAKFYPKGFAPQWFLTLAQKIMPAVTFSFLIRYPYVRFNT
jgi:hypothetical protein